MSRAIEIRELCEDHRGAYQVFVTPDENHVRIRFADDHLGNPDLRFPAVTVSHKEFRELIDPNKLTEASMQVAMERGDTIGLFVSPYIVSRLARRGVPNTATKYQHTLNRQEPTSDDFNRNGMMSGRV